MEPLKPIKFFITPVGRPKDAFLAIFEIERQDDYYYCHLKLSEHAKWEEVRRLMSLNYWLEWDNSDPEFPKLRLAKCAYADNLAAPRSTPQTKFSQHLPGILQKDPDGWHVVIYAQTESNLQITFEYSDSDSDDNCLAHIQIDFMKQYVCHAEIG